MLSINELTKYQSKNWDMDISLDELVATTGNMYCYVDRNYKKLNSHNDCGAYDGVCIYLKHDINSDSYCQIGVSEDGFVYISDAVLNNVDDYYKYCTPVILEEMYYYGHYIRCRMLNQLIERNEDD